MLNDTDKQIIESIEKRIALNPDYWSFKEIRKKSGIHNIMRYPATMVPQMLEELITILAAETNSKNILDPFMGSGTVLVEGIKNKLNVYGIDINPMAYLLCKAKTQYVSTISLEKEYTQLINDIELGLPLKKIHHFTNIDKWFRKDIIIELSKLKTRIESISNKRVKLIFMICFADTITDVKNSRSSTWKLHAKSTEQIENFTYDVLNQFSKKLKLTISWYKSHLNEIKLNSQQKNSIGVKAKISCGDSRNLKKSLCLKDSSIDLIVTSPPYGDNGTTVPYGQYSSLHLFWLENNKEMKKFNTELFKTFSSVDSLSLGGKLYPMSFIHETEILKQSKSLSDYINKLLIEKQEKKARKVCSFIIDFSDSLREQIDVLRSDGYMLLVVGNRKVHNITVPFDDIIKEIVSKKTFLVTSFQRNIYNKKIAKKVSKVGNSAVETMSKETILILRKK
ncbi:DNA methyltransferase [Bacillus solimangrovi]|uniref:site-specific DNA-methyltransferase (cytosine-N(4)-specific) n=1 Tax=Bacillus solimangrovi TaxID=1305675 RepID=A0A1E5LER6_9BACI|nr:DNA methyltransferase [Bacillus solimangrovi]OEH92573.1 hypothetical protein BFG57_15285 [Bacillus solimangrovi]